MNFQVQQDVVDLCEAAFPRAEQQVEFAALEHHPFLASRQSPLKKLSEQIGVCVAQLVCALVATQC